MGFNSVIFICNDHMSEIDADPESWWKRASHELVKVHMNRSQGSFGNGSYAVWNQHADTLGLIAVGGNYATVLPGRLFGRIGHHTTEGQLALLREAANALGYDLVRKEKT